MAARLLTTVQAGEHGITVYIDPHQVRYSSPRKETLNLTPPQDVWSRWTGGDGAPGWTLEAVGFDVGKL